MSTEPTPPVMENRQAPNPMSLGALTVTPSAELT
jgi:hypothetical protein